MRSISLRRRLIAVATLLLAVSLGLVGVALNAANQRSAVSSLQARMESYVYAVLAAMEPNGGGGLAVEDDFADPRLARPGSGFYVIVQGPAEEWRSPSALGVALPQLSRLQAGRAVFQEPGRDREYFVYQYGIGWQMPDGSIEPFTVSVLVDPAEFEKETSAFRSHLWRWLGAAGVILAAAQILILYLVFRPLGRVARDVARIESGRAGRLEGDYPRELEPLARNVNRLLETEQSNQERIRNALDSLAHSLKTPLAVIQAGIPLHGGAASSSMQNAVDEINRLVATRLERAGSGTRRTLARPVPVEPQLQRILDSLHKVHSRKMINSEVKIAEGLAFCGEERDLLELLGNLLDNAFKYGRGHVLISAGPVDDPGQRPGIWLRVEDDGPGIAPADRERLLQRGVRGDERVEGHGLGLAIVLEVVTAYGGEVAIGESDLGGASITVRIPPT